ncbi:MAG: DUF2764 family protein [Candidatus Omnitrophota bacterium]
MSNKYYYLVASLPYLKFEAEPPLSREDFISECEKWLSPEEMKVVLSADLEALKKFDAGLSRELVRVRTERKTTGSFKAGELLKGVMEQENPLLMEKTLEKLRWDFIEDKETEYMFDVSWLAFYFLKLQILERLAGFNKDKGEAYFYELCEVHYE